MQSLTDMDDKSPDVLVIGGGAVGVCCAYELAKAGVNVTLVERGDSLASECSYGNTGMIRLSHVAPLATPGSIMHALRWSLSEESPFKVRARTAVVPWLARFLAAATPRQVTATSNVLRRLTQYSHEIHRSYFESGIETG
ncbi:MAG: FAD-dependent oxidoreductase [Hyphomicrobiaceae bacterium]